VRIEDKSALVDADGTITIEVNRVPAHEEWWIQAIYVQCSSTSQCAFAAYRDEPEFGRVIAATNWGTFNTDDNGSEKWLQSGTRIVVQWTGCSATDSLGNPSKGEVTMQIAKRRV